MPATGSKKIDTVAAELVPQKRRAASVHNSRRRILRKFGTLPTGLDPDTPYWLIHIDADTLQLAASRADAFGRRRRRVCGCRKYSSRLQVLGGRPRSRVGSRPGTGRAPDRDEAERRFRLAQWTGTATSSTASASGTTIGFGRR